jgi:2-deoxy-D-gluconate 3-dehydrogenase
MSTVLDLFRLDRKVAIVTGAGRGLGQGMAIALAEAGADVAAVDIGDVTETRTRITQLGRRCAAITADLGKGGEAAQAVIDQAMRELGRIDILVNNAGIIRRADFLEFSAKDWDEVMAVNLDAVFHLSQRTARQMVAQGQGGRIINIASMLSFQGGIRVPSYTASKSAVAGLTRLMACELGPKGITTNAIAPGYMATDNTAALRADEARNASILERIPLGRWGTPADLTGMVVVLASAAGAYCNGYVYAVDGGWLAR